MYLRLSGAFHGTCVLFASQTRPILYLRFFEKSKNSKFWPYGVEYENNILRVDEDCSDTYDDVKISKWPKMHLRLICFARQSSEKVVEYTRNICQHVR